MLNKIRNAFYKIFKRHHFVKFGNMYRCEYCGQACITKWFANSETSRYTCPHNIIHEGVTMDIGAKCGYPAYALSNFAPHVFKMDGVEIRSMEGFLQSLKFSNFEMAKEVCKLVGRAAKFKGKHKRWQVSQELHWNNVVYKRDSDEYQALLLRAYTEMTKQSNGFRAALAASGNAKLTHSLGRNKINDTVLTERGFCSLLHNMRDKLNRGEI